MRIATRAWVCAAITALASHAHAQTAAPVPLERFVEATWADERAAGTALHEIAAGWKNSYTPMFVDLARMMRPPRAAGGETPRSNSTGDDRDDADADRPTIVLPDIPDRGSPIRRRLLTFLAKQTGKGFGDDLNAWRRWMWTLPYDPHPDYARLKGIVYSAVDPRMRAFFPRDVRSVIRLDEIDWGGVTVNGIPPLRSPKVVAVPDARYLKDSNVVFGIVVNGEEIGRAHV